MKFCARVLAAGLVLFGAAIAARGVETPEGAVKDRQGLCVVIGCGKTGSEGLVAELAGKSKMLVYGVALDDAAVERVRRAIEKGKVAGQAAVEKVSVKPLPLVSDVANVVVVEEEAMAAGLTSDEIMRVTAPFGTVYMRQGNGWKVETKGMPAEMDEWPQPWHGADLNKVSKDKAFGAAAAKPLWIRWQEGIPVNATGAAGTPTWLVAGGRAFTYGVNEMENLPPPAIHKATEYALMTPIPQWVSARDAFNGMPLWKVATGTKDEGTRLGWTSEQPLVTDGKYVWAGTMDSVLCLDAATGKQVAVYKTAHRPYRLVVIDGIVVASCWGEQASAGYLWVPGKIMGTVEAFDGATGVKKWSVPGTAFRIAAAGDTVYLLNEGATKELAAVDLKTGKEKWRKGAADLNGAHHIDLESVGPGYAIVFVAREGRDGDWLVLSPADGKVQWQVKNDTMTFAPVIDGLMWGLGKRYDPLTGAVKGSFEGRLYRRDVCQTSLMVPGFFFDRASFVGVDTDSNKGISGKFLISGFRTSCGEQGVPAYGSLYLVQSYCKCVPGQPYGMVALGANGDWPSKDDFAKVRPVEKGKGFGQVKASGAAEEWTTYRGNGERSSSTKAEGPGKLNGLWKVGLTEGDGTMASAWRPQLASMVTAPVVTGGTVLVASTDGGQLFALEARSGKQLWTKTLASRIDSPPTVSNGLAILGCHDGWCYALRLADGELAWRTQVAPLEKRMISFGKVESAWPAIGSVLVNGDVAYVDAGRTSEFEGGVAMVALNAQTGETKWGRTIGTGGLRINDLLTMQGKDLGWHSLTFDAADGKQTGPDKPDDARSYGGGARVVPGGMIDWTWTQSNNRRSHAAYARGKVTADMMAWNADVFATGKGLFSAKDESQIWKTPFPANIQVEALVIAGSKVIFAGSDMAVTPQKFSMYVCSIKDGSKLAEMELESRPTHNGLAVAGGKVFLTLYNGKVMCLGQ